MHVQAFILAAGESRRFSGVKQLARLSDGHLLLDKVLKAFLSAEAYVFCSYRVTLVLGANANEIERRLVSVPNKNIEVFIASDWSKGMGVSLALAMSSCIDRNTTHLLVGLGDQIDIETTSLVKLLRQSAAAESNDKEPSFSTIVAASYNETSGVPAVFPSAYFDALSTLNEDKGARDVICRSKNLILVDLPEAAIDIDTEQDLRLWNRTHTSPISEELTE